jgi:hypothetical protein
VFQSLKVLCGLCDESRIEAPLLSFVGDMESPLRRQRCDKCDDDGTDEREPRREMVGI